MTGLVAPSTYPPLGDLTSDNFQDLVAIGIRPYRKNGRGAVPPFFVAGTIPADVKPGTYLLRVDKGVVTLYPPRTFLVNATLDSVALAAPNAVQRLRKWRELGPAAENLVLFEGGTLKVSYLSVEDSMFFFDIKTSWDVMGQQ